MGDKQKVLVAEGDESIRKLLAHSLGQSGYDVAEASDRASALAVLDSRKPDLIILDLAIPVMNGLEVLNMIQTLKDMRQMPVIMLTAKGDDSDKVQGFEKGADDYLTKPFGMNELLARVRALLRRASPSEVDETESGKSGISGLQIDKQARRAYAAGDEISLTMKEFDLLSFFLCNVGIVFTREKLFEEVWGSGYYGDLRTVDVHVTRLRSKLGPFARLIETVRGIGYKMNGDELH